MRGLGDEDFFAMHGGESESVLQKLLTSTTMGFCGELEEIQWDELGEIMRGVVDAVNDDDVHAVILKPGVHGGLMHDAPIKAHHACMIQRGKDRGHAGAGNDGSSQ